MVPFTESGQGRQSRGSRGRGMGIGKDTGDYPVGPWCLLG